MNDDPVPTSTATVPSAAHCALHVDRLALAPCARCGTFLCAACAIRPDWADGAYCKDCVTREDRTGGGGVVPWEEKDTFFLKRFVRTVWAVLTSPVRFFTRLGPHGYGPAITFQYTVMPLVLLLNLVVTWLRLRAMFGNLFSPSQISALYMRSIVGLVVAVALIPILHFVAAGWMHLHFLLFGAKRGFAATYRLTSYLYALLLVFGVLQLIPAVTQVDLRQEEIQALMRGKTSGVALAMMILTSVIGVVYTTIAGAKAQRLHPAASFGAVMLVTLEGFALWVYVLVPVIERAASTGRF